MAGVTRRNILQAVAIAFATPFIPACGGGGPEPNAGPSNSISKTNTLLIYPNSLDPRIIGGSVDAGERFVLYGEKDNNGQILSANEMNFIASDLETSTMKFVSAENKFIGLSNGVQIDFAKDTVGGLNFGLVAGDKQLAINLPPQSIANITKENLSQSNQSRLGRPIQLAITDRLCSCSSALKPTNQYLMLADAVAVAPIASVSVSGCIGQNTTVIVTMRNEKGQVVDTLLGKPESSSRYNVLIPYLNTGDQALAEASKSVMDFLSGFGITEGVFSSILQTLKDKTLGEMAEGPDTTSISPLTLIPSNPSQDQDYVATGEVFCLLDGDVVSLSVIGTDDFSKTISETVGQAETKSFQLRVPGAEAGVRDLLTLQVKRNGTVVATISASLIFG